MLIPPVWLNVPVTVIADVLATVLRGNGELAWPRVQVPLLPVL